MHASQQLPFEATQEFIAAHSENKESNQGTALLSDGPPQQPEIVRSPFPKEFHDKTIRECHDVRDGLVKQFAEHGLRLATEEEARRVYDDHCLKAKKPTRRQDTSALIAQRIGPYVFGPVAVFAVSDRGVHDLKTRHYDEVIIDWRTKLLLAPKSV
jgi:hypothetical protein